MEIKAARNFITTKRIELGEFFGGDEGAFIIIREPSKTELFDLSKAYGSEDESKAAASIGKLLPNLITDHGFTDNGKKVPAGKVGELIESITNCWTFVYNQLSEVLPITAESEEGKKK